MEEIRILLRELSQKPIAYFKVFADISGGVTSGVMLSQIMYWWGSMNGKEFFKTDKDFAQELGLSLWELKRAKRKLTKLQIIKINRRGVPAKSYYSVNEDQLITLMVRLSKTNQLDVAKPTNWIKQNQPTNTENNTENNKEKDIGISDEMPLSQAKDCFSSSLELQDTERKEESYPTGESRLPGLENTNIPIKEIIDDLNSKAGTRFRYSTGIVRRLICARWKEGFRLQDFKKVHSNQVAEWKDNPKMCKYLRPQTLYSTKFDAYLNNVPRVRGSPLSNPNSEENKRVIEAARQRQKELEQARQKMGQWLAEQERLREEKKKNAT